MEPNTESEWTGVDDPRLWAFLRDEYEAAMIARGLLPEPATCAPAIGVHRLCPHDVEIRSAL